MLHHVIDWESGNDRPVESACRTFARSANRARRTRAAATIASSKSVTVIRNLGRVASNWAGHRAAAGPDLQNLTVESFALQRPGQHDPAGESTPARATAKGGLEA